MKNLNVITVLGGLLVASAIGCGASSAEEQRRAQTHQYKSDEAAEQGRFGVAEDEQRKAHDSHHSAVEKAIDEGKPIPPQTRRGDPPPPQPRH